MPTLSQHQSNEYTKLILLGDSKAGKTGSLCSLIPSFNLRILDLDNGLDSLKQQATHLRYDLNRIEYRTLRDNYKSSPLGPIIAGQPRAFVDALRMLDTWKFDGTDLGPPSEWGPDYILVVDSLSFLSDAAFAWAEALNPSAKDRRQTYGMAQDAIEKVLALLTSPNFQTNVIVISHVKYIDNPDGTRKGYPNAVGSALSPIIPRYFNSVALCQTSASGRRTIQTRATASIDLANPAPFTMEKEYPIETGLATYFEILRAKDVPLIRDEPMPGGVQPGLPLKREIHAKTQTQTQVLRKPLRVR